MLTRHSFNHVLYIFISIYLYINIKTLIFQFSDSSKSSKNLKRLRRRTTVFTEAQQRILYMHFTHCNFPDPAMFKILSYISKLDHHVIKIWFQNERSRQRRRSSQLGAEGWLKYAD